MAENAEMWAVPFFWMASCCKKSTRAPGSQEEGSQQSYSPVVSENGHIWGSLSPRALDSQPGSRVKIRYSSEKAARGPAPWGGPNPWTTLLHQSPAHQLQGPQPSRPGRKGTPYGGTLTHYPLVPGEAKASRLGIGAYSTARQGHSSKDVTSNCQETAGSCLCSKNFLHPRGGQDHWSLTLY